jgi:hypothetical protein
VFFKFLDEFFLADADAVANRGKVGVEHSRLLILPLGLVRLIHNVAYGFIGIAVFSPFSIRRPVRTLTSDFAADVSCVEPA